MKHSSHDLTHLLWHQILLYLLPEFVVFMLRHILNCFFQCSLTFATFGWAGLSCYISEFRHLSLAPLTVHTPLLAYGVNIWIIHIGVFEIQSLFVWVERRFSSCITSFIFYYNNLIVSDTVIALQRFMTHKALIPGYTGQMAPSIFLWHCQLAIYILVFIQT